ncbi:MAG: DNA-processing protein DprA [Fimbriimonadaceae bacterium]
MLPEIAAVLATHLVGAPPRWAGRAFDRMLADSLGRNRDDLGPDLHAVGAPEQDVEEILGRLDSAAERLARLSDVGIRLVVRGGAGFPPAWDARLRQRAPRACFAAGDDRLFRLPMVAVVGSRALDERAAFAARAFAEAAVGRSRAVVSGGARGADRIAMDAALESDGSTVGILASGLAKPMSTGETRRRIDSGRLALLSPYAPDASFSVGQAMGRNRLVYGIARCTVVVACEVGTGGTWAGALDAIKLGLGPVFVWTGAGSPAANRELLKHGASPCEDPGRLAAWLDGHPESFPAVDPTPEPQPGLPF